MTDEKVIMLIEAKIQPQRRAELSWEIPAASSGGAKVSPYDLRRYAESWIMPNQV